MTVGIVLINDEKKSSSELYDILSNVIVGGVILFQYFIQLWGIITTRS